MSDVPNQAASQQERCEEAERNVQTFSYNRANGKKVGGGVKEIVSLARTRSTKVAVQVVKEGGENNLHFHRKTEIVYTVLKGRAKFYGPEDKLYGEFGQYEGILLPADSRYWFEKAGEEDLELLQVTFSGDAANAARVNVDLAKDWMGGVAELQVYENGSNPPTTTSEQA